MIAKRPSIFIYTYNPTRSVLKEICAGIEEEGVFFEVFEKNDASAEKLATDAANDSMLGSGIGINGSVAVLQIKGLSEGHCVSCYESPDVEESRTAGANSARIIKKMPLK